ncbi:MAG: substrate-binding domain-containing protein [Caldilineaceae bacterium]|nr:substrate-binding domain-containing protein [Caldilineaceae bacterium]
MRASGLAVDPSLIRSGAFTVDGGAAMMAEVLAERPDVTGIFAANNFIAAGALRALQAAGKRVPDDMSVVVFDDLPGVFAADPWLTVAAQPAYELGRTATQRLLQRIGAPAPLPCEDIVLPGRIIVRNSTRAPRLGDWPAEQVRRDVPVA